MTTAPELRAVIVTELSQRPRRTRELAELAGMEWGERARRKVNKAIASLCGEGFVIVNILAAGSHSGGLYAMTMDPDLGPVRVPLPQLRCGTPGCRTYLARDHILGGSLYCSPCWERRVHAGVFALLGLPETLQERLPI